MDERDLLDVVSQMKREEELLVHVLVVRIIILIIAMNSLLIRPNYPEKFRIFHVSVCMRSRLITETYVFYVTPICAVRNRSA